MDGDGKSDRPVVPAKPPNKAAVAEAAEERGLAKGNAASETRPGRSAGQDVPNGLDRVRRIAATDKEARFTALMHHVSLERLWMAYRDLSPKASPGVDGVMWEDYGQDLVANLRDLHDRVHSGRYRARPSRRAYIPKADGRLRPLGIAALEDKILQRAVAGVLNAVYEADFLGFSYGFRPRRSPHDALDALAVGIERKKVNWVLDADIRDFFTSLDHYWLEKFLEHRIADKRMLRLLRKWLKAGVIEDGKWSQTPEGAPQGASASPLMANVYLHYVFDLWADWWRKRYAHGDVIFVRFADDFIAGFEHQADAQRFLADLRERFAKFGLDLHEGKTRLIEFGRTRPAAEGTRARQAGDVRLPGLHAHLREDQGRALRAAAGHDLEADASQAARAQERAHAAAASARSRAGQMAGKRGARALRLLRRARQQQGGQGIPDPGDQALAPGATAPQSAHPPELGTHGPPRHPVAAQARIMHPWPSVRFDARTRGRSPVR